MDQREVDAFKSEFNPYRPSIDEGTKEEQTAWNNGVDALFHYIQRQNNGIDEECLDRIILRQLKERIKQSGVTEELTDEVIDKMVSECIEHYYNHNE